MVKLRVSIMTINLISVSIFITSAYVYLHTEIKSYVLFLRSAYRFLILDLRSEAMTI